MWRNIRWLAHKRESRLDSSHRRLSRANFHLPFLSLVSLGEHGGIAPTHCSPFVAKLPSRLWTDRCYPIPNSHSTQAMENMT